MAQHTSLSALSTGETWRSASTSRPTRSGELFHAIEALRTCEEITKCRVAAGFLAWPRRDGGGNTRSGVADALHRPAGCLRQAVSLRSAVPPEQRRPIQKDAQPCGREQERPSGRVARSVTARCGMRPRGLLARRPFLLSRGVLEFFHRFLGEFGYFWIDL
jgi:hypothetical protein